jgi:hypothetical protein
MSLDELRQAIGSAPVTLKLLEKTLGTRGVYELRRSYFPRWRPGRPHAADESLRAFRTVIVEDTFEAEVVSALAPADLKVSVRLDSSMREPVETSAKALAAAPS